MKKREAQRKQDKSAEGELLYELQQAYELSPKLSEQILLSAKEHLGRGWMLREGQVEVSVVGMEERSGKVMEKVRVRLTLDKGVEDIEVEKEFGRVGLRQVRLQRLCDEAVEQEGVLSQEDLSKYLACSLRTVKRDIKAIAQRGVQVITRGVLHNIGRGQTHKAKIVGLYLEGLTYSELKLRTRHSVGAIKRYVESFSKVVMAERCGIVEAPEISGVTGLSVTLVKQYQEVLSESAQDATKREQLAQLVERTGYREGLKKTSKISGSGAVLMIGGSR